MEYKSAPSASHFTDLDFLNVFHSYIALCWILTILMFVVHANLLISSIWLQIHVKKRYQLTMSRNASCSKRMVFVYSVIWITFIIYPIITVSKDRNLFFVKNLTQWMIHVLHCSAQMIVLLLRLFVIVFLLTLNILT